METTHSVDRQNQLGQAHVANSNGFSSRPAPQTSHLTNGAHGTNGVHGVSAPAPITADRVVAQLGKIFKLLADETRLRILFELTHTTELHVRAFCDLLGQSQPAVSHHLALLLEDGLIERRREGKHNFYRLVPRRMENLFELVFDGVPHDQRKFRIENYELSFAPRT